MKYKTLSALFFFSLFLVIPTNAKDNSRMLKIPFATNRISTPQEDTKNFFGETMDKLQHYGIANVAVPQVHTKGELDLLENYETAPLKHITLDSIKLSFDAKNFNQELNNRLIEKSDRNIFLFVNDFNTDFSYTLRQIVRLYTDQVFIGLPVVYSWPSQSVNVPLPASFRRDMSVLSESLPAIKEFIKSLLPLVNVASDQCLNLVSLSDSNTAVYKILESIEKENPQAPLFCSVHISAREIDSKEVLSNFTQRFPLSTKEIKLHISPY